MGEAGTAAVPAAARDAMVDEARAIVDAARRRGVTLRMYGGLAVRAHCDVVAFCARDYSDIDLIGLHAQQVAIRSLFHDLGYEENVHITQATWNRQLQFVRPCAHGDGEGRAHEDDHVDVSLDTFTMDHRIDLATRLGLDDYTIPVGDQLLTKLQVYRQDEKDVRDVVTLLKDLELADDDAPGAIGLKRIAALCADDWGLYHDVERNLERDAAQLPAYSLPEEDERRVRDGLERLRRALEQAPKSRRWRWRARVGERLPWHDPVEGQVAEP